jgi:hypothetical protein
MLFMANRERISLLQKGSSAHPSFHTPDKLKLISAAPYGIIGLTRKGLKGTEVNEYKDPKPEEGQTVNEVIQQVKAIEDEPIDVTFFDRVLAFLVLIYPFSLLIDKMQELLLERVGTTVNNMLILVGLIAFLLVVNTVAKLLYKLRHSNRT